MEKILSIIVPSFNMECYLPKCLNSLIINDKEFLQKLDIIVVNDGSTDSTSEIAHEFETNYPDVFRVIDKPNGHYGSCINVALSVAKGIFVKILDADDCFDHQGFEKLLETLCSINLLSESQIDVVFTNSEMVKNNDETGRYCTWFDKYTQDYDLADLDYGEIVNLWMHQFTYRTSILLTCNYKQSEGIPFTDQEWIFKPMSMVRKACILPVVVYRYMVGRDGQTINEHYYLKNFSVIRSLTLKHIDEYVKCLPYATSNGAFYLEKRLFSRIKLVYDRHLINSKIALKGEEKALIDFDIEFKQKLPKLYQEVGRIRILQRIPIGYINVWRRKIGGKPFMYWLLWKILLPMAMMKRRCFNRISTRQ